MTNYIHVSVLCVSVHRSTFIVLIHQSKVIAKVAIIAKTCGICPKSIHSVKKQFYLYSCLWHIIDLVMTNVERWIFVLLFQQQQIFDIQHFLRPNWWQARDISQSKKIMLQQTSKLKRGKKYFSSFFSYTRDRHSGQS